MSCDSPYSITATVGDETTTFEACPGDPWTLDASGCFALFFSAEPDGTFDVDDFTELCATCEGGEHCRLPQTPAWRHDLD